MSPILIAVLGVVVLLLAIFLIVVAMRPNEFKVTRAASLAAPAATLFERVNDFHQWTSWSPWEDKDPAMKKIYDGPPAGVGTHYHWVGNKNVGEGMMTITESRPNELIRIKLEFLKPFKGTNDTVFTFKPENAGTAVTWTMSGNYNFFTKMFGLFMNMDKMIGTDFEKGLAQLGAAAKSPAKV